MLHDKAVLSVFEHTFKRMATIYLTLSMVQTNSPHASLQVIFGNWCVYCTFFGARSLCLRLSKDCLLCYYTVPSLALFEFASAYIYTHIFAHISPSRFHASSCNCCTISKNHQCRCVCEWLCICTFGAILLPERNTHPIFAILTNERVE